jgi:AraC family transcriptional regulator
MPPGIIREIDAPLVCRTDVRSRHVSVERMRRRGDGPVRWRYRQDRHALFCFERGVRSCAGALDGRTVRQTFAGDATLAFVAAGALVEAVFDVPAECSYLVAFFDAAPFTSDDEELARLGVPRSQIGFSDPSLALAVGQLRRELARADSLSSLVVEGWAAQAWGLLHRRQAGDAKSAGRLGPAILSQMLRHMRERLADDVSLAELAGLAGLSPRQFCRRFQAATGSTPARTLDTMRLDLASDLLAKTRRSVTEIALDCGFSQPQHLATAFKRRFGTTPTEFRAAMS